MVDVAERSEDQNQEGSSCVEELGVQKTVIEEEEAASVCGEEETTGDADKTQEEKALSEQEEKAKAREKPFLKETEEKAQETLAREEDERQKREEERQKREAHANKGKKSTYVTGWHQYDGTPPAVSRAHRVFGRGLHFL
jgi:Zn-dependent metalloprotease